MSAVSDGDVARGLAPPLSAQYVVAGEAENARAIDRATLMQPAAEQTFAPGHLISAPSQKTTISDICPTRTGL